MAAVSWGSGTTFATIDTMPFGWLSSSTLPLLVLWPLTAAFADSAFASSPLLVLPPLVLPSTVLSPLVGSLPSLLML